jgi:hypothetical protein
MANDNDELELDPELEEAHHDIVSERARLKLKHRLNRNKRMHLHRPELDQAKSELNSQGIDSTLLE